MRVPGLKAVARVFLAVVLSAPLLAADTAQKTAVPGTLN